MFTQRLDADSFPASLQGISEIVYYCCPGQLNGIAFLFSLEIGTKLIALRYLWTEENVITNAIKKGVLFY